jgi:glycine/D-amino acid oxidase-like deaminating enzyme
VFGARLVFPDDNVVERVEIDAHDVRQAFTRLETRVRGLHPALAGVRVTHRWGGPIAFRAERDPICARLPEAPGVIVTGGYAGHGVALSLRLGTHLADAITRDVPLPAFGALAPR